MFGAAFVAVAAANAVDVVDVAAVAAVVNDEVAAAVAVSERARLSATLHGCGPCRILDIFLSNI